MNWFLFIFLFLLTREKNWIFKLNECADWIRNPVYSVSQPQMNWLYIRLMTVHIHCTNVVWLTCKWCIRIMNMTYVICGLYAIERERYRDCVSLIIPTSYMECYDWLVAKPMEWIQRTVSTHQFYDEFAGIFRLCICIANVWLFCEIEINLLFQ